MTKSCCFILILLGFWSIVALNHLQAQQVVNISGIDLFFQKIPYYDTTGQSNQKVLVMAYAEYKIRNKAEWNSQARKGKTVYEIDLVYSDYPQDTSKWIFRYHQLMPARIKEILKLDPSLKNLPIKWNLVAQTNCSTAVIAESIFHGAVLKYRNENENILNTQPPITKDTVKQANPNTSLADQKNDSKTEANKTSSNNLPPTKAAKIESPKANDQFTESTPNPVDTTKNNNLKPDLATKQPKTDTIKIAEKNNNLKPNTSLQNPNTPQARGTENNRTSPQKNKKEGNLFEEGNKGQGQYSGKGTLGNAFTPDNSRDKQKALYNKYVEDNMQIVEEIISGIYPLEDSSVIHVLNKHKDWNDMVVIMDWTGSMYPYGAQVIRWHKQQIQRRALKHLTIFNDGDDNLRDELAGPKPIGNAGGIYFIDPQNIEDVLETMKQCMLGGDGGEIPENNMEALIKTQEKFPNVKRYFMIADKRAPIRDLVLIRHVRKPIYVIPAGEYPLIHPDYIYIAWKTGGSIFVENDEVNFDYPEMPIKKGYVKIGKVKYKFSEAGRNFSPILTPKIRKELELGS